MVSIHHIFGTTLSLSRRTERLPLWRSRTGSSNDSRWKIAFKWERIFYILWERVKRCKAFDILNTVVLFLFQYERVYKPCMTNAQSGYNGLFSSWFSENWSLFSQRGLDLEEFIVDVIIPALLSFWIKEFVDFGFQVSIRNLEFVGDQIYVRFGCQVFSFISFHFNVSILLIVHTWNSSPFEVISSGCNGLVPFQQLLEGPMEVLLCEHVNDLRHSLFYLLNCLTTTASELRE